MVTAQAVGVTFYSSRWSLLMALLLLAGCSGPEQGRDSLEERAQGIDRRLVCPVCPGETIDQSQVELARQMRAEVREKLRAGWSQEQILQYFSAPERYGEEVLSSPPRRGFGLIVWLVPPAVVLAGLALLVLAVRRMRRQGEQPSAEGLAAAPGGLAPYLAMVDRELLGRPSSIPTGPEVEALERGGEEADEGNDGGRVRRG